MGDRTRDGSAGAAAAAATATRCGSISSASTSSSAGGSCGVRQYGSTSSSRSGGSGGGFDRSSGYGSLRGAALASVAWSSGDSLTLGSHYAAASARGRGLLALPDDNDDGGGDDEGCERTFVAEPARPTASASGDGLAGERGWIGGFVFLLASVVLERFAYYSLVSGVARFLTREPLCWPAGDAATVGVALSAAAHFLTLPSAVVADLVSSRAVVAAGYAIYVVGLAMAAVHGLGTDGFGDESLPEGAPACSPAANFSFPLVCPSDEHRPCRLWTYATCMLVGLATAQLRATVPPLCAEQVKSKGLATTRSVLAWYYWGANIGALIAYTTVTRLQDQVGFLSGFTTPLLAVMLSCVLFFSGSHKYSWHLPNPTAIGNVFGIIRSGVRHVCTKPCRLGCFDYAKAINGGAYTSTAVEQVKTSGRACAALFLMLPFFAILSRIMSAFWQEGLHMSNVQSGIQGEAQLAQAIMYLGTSVALPLCNMVIYPLAGRHGYRMTMYRRFVLGMLIGVACLVAAGIVDKLRFDGARSSTQELIGHTYYNVSSVSILWQMPQQFLLGASQACTTVTALEFTYIAAPRSMQCLLMAIFWCVFGLADLINLGVLQAIPYSVSIDVQQSYHLEYFYLMLAAVLCSVAAAVAVVGRMVDVGLDTLTVEAARRLPVPTRLHTDM